MKFFVAGLTEILAGGISGEHGAIDPKFFWECQQKIVDGTLGLGLQVRRIHKDFSHTVDNLISYKKSRFKLDSLKLQSVLQIFKAK